MLSDLVEQGAVGIMYVYFLGSDSFPLESYVRLHPHEPKMITSWYKSGHFWGKISPTPEIKIWLVNLHFLVGQR